MTIELKIGGYGKDRMGKVHGPFRCSMNGNGIYGFCATGRPR